MLTSPDGAEPPGGQESRRTRDSANAERRLLRGVFQHAPLPLFVLERDGIVRRANDAAGALTGVPAGYATGRPLTAFVDVPFRAAVTSQLAAVVRNGTPRQADCKLLGPAGAVAVVLTASAVDLQDGQRLLVVAASSAEEGFAGQAGEPRYETPDLEAHAPEVPVSLRLRALTRRVDTVTAVTRLLLDNSTFSEAVTLQRCARLLASEMADWVIADMVRDGRLRRQLVTGADEELARMVRRVEPETGTLPWQVHAAGKAILRAHTAELGDELGAGEDGVPLAMRLGVTSVVSVPIRDPSVPAGDSSEPYGALTLARGPERGPFSLAELALIEDIGEHLGVAIRVDRLFRHRSSVAEALQGSLLPGALPEVPGFELSAAYLPAGSGLEVSGDFYDVFPVVGGGWAFMIGDVCGKGQEAAAMTAAARHAIRVLSAFTPDPVDVLVKANEILLGGDYEDRFVTAKLAYVDWAESGPRVRLASAGHPGPALVRADGRVEMLGGGGLPLGLFPDAEPSLETFSLSVGDLLFFFSDGVTDARGEDLDHFEDRLADSLAGLAGRSAAETARAVQSLLVSFAGDELRDDVTILVAGVTGV